MPVQIIDTLDPLRQIVRFQTSAVYELVIGLKSLFRPTSWQVSWAERARTELAGPLLAELTFLYQNFNEGDIYIELPVDYADHNDVRGFFDYVRRLPEAEFLFYLTGRVIAPAEMVDLIDQPDSLRQTLDLIGVNLGWNARMFAPILDDLPGFRMRLLAAWEATWERFFAREIEGFFSIWESGMADKRRLLEREGGAGLLAKTTGRAQLPPDVPPGVPVREIIMVPVYLLPSPAIRFYGYGNMTVLFDPLYSEERRQSVEGAQEEATLILKALADKTRLEILRLIATHDGRLHGKSIAQRTGITASAVSRHLKLLKESNLVGEEQHRNVTLYHIRRETLAQLPERLFRFLDG
ncbi:MAG: winged helix-turn-helix transcriptional regulator [Anaerolineae bacterium]|nr:winged helix-turn-helix transcriptional regulator [Anaerolineae bacterium]